MKGINAPKRIKDLTLKVMPIDRKRKPDLLLRAWCVATSIVALGFYVNFYVTRILYIASLLCRYDRSIARWAIAANGTFLLPTHLKICLKSVHTMNEQPN